MIKNQRPIWITIAIIVLALVLNIIIIKTAYTNNQNLLWILIVSISLLILAIYGAWQTKHLLRQYFIDSLKPTSPQNHFEMLSHSIYPSKIGPTELKVLIGNDQCTQPYDACIFNVTSMKNSDPENIFIHQKSQKTIEYTKYSNDEGLSTYHLAAGGLLLQIGSGFIGCRTETGSFDNKAFKQTAHKAEIKMIELKLSSATNPIYSANLFLDTAEPFNRKRDNSIFPDSANTYFKEAEGMIHFLNNLRELSGGKPIGIRLCIHDKREFYQICHAVRKTQIIPDFIVVEDSFEIPGVVHSHKASQFGMPLYEALLFVSQTLQFYGLKKKIQIIADGKIISCFDILKVLALGANAVCTEMPDYSKTKYSGNGRKVSTPHKDQSVYDFHNSLMKATVQIMNICGFMTASDITLSKFFRRLDVLHSKTFEELNDSILYPGPLQKIYNSKIKSYQMQDERKTTIA